MPVMSEQRAAVLSLLTDDLSMPMGAPGLLDHCWCPNMLNDDLRVKSD